MRTSHLRTSSRQLKSSQRFESLQLQRVQLAPRLTPAEKPHEVLS
jgi:hypothetical protein